MKTVKQLEQAEQVPNYPNIMMPKRPGRQGFGKTQWVKNEMYSTLYGLTKTPENNMPLCNDTVLRHYGRKNKNFQERQMLKFDPEFYDHLFNDWHEYEGFNYLLEVSMFMEYMRYHLDLMYNQPLAEIPYEQHKYLGNRQYEKMQQWGDSRDWELEYMEKILGNLEGSYYSADGSWAYQQEYEMQSDAGSRGLRDVMEGRTEKEVGEFS